MDILDDFGSWMKANRTTTVPRSIGNLTDAIVYWRSGRGGTVPGNEDLYEEMQSDSSFEDCFGPDGSITELLESKIRKALRSGARRISAPPGSFRGLRCATLGSYRLDIDYDHAVSRRLNEVGVQLSGSDLWDFETNPNEGFVHNLCNEWIPEMMAGEGKPFSITYDFTITISIEI
jgi:hypothetical protein